MILANTGVQHGKTINELAAEGKIKPCTIVFEDGSIPCNSVWAATDWLKANGFYAGKGKAYRVKEQD